jgi:hypothetical protein
MAAATTRAGHAQPPAGQRSARPPGKIMTGYYPDPLLPNGTFDLKPDRLQCV